MKKDDKSKLIASMRERFEKSEAVFVVTQNKMTVAESENLRKQLRGASASYFIPKNTLVRLAVDGTKFDCLKGSFKGQSAVVFSNDITSAAKVIDEYASKNNEKIVISCGGFQGNVLSASEVKILAQLPSMDELRAKIIAVIQTPAQRLAVLAQAPAAQIARVLDAYSKK